MSDRQPLLASAARTSHAGLGKTKGVNPSWSPQGKKWMKKPVAASSPGQSTRRGSSHVRLPDSSSDEDSDPDDSNVFSPVVKDSEVTAKVCEQRQPTRRERWAYYMDYTTFGRWWQVLDAALNVAYVVLFIHMTTYIIAPSRDPTARPGAPPDTLFMADMILAIIILAQYVPRVYLSLEPGAAAISGMSLASYLATLPVIYAYFQHDDANTDYLDASQFLAFLYPLRFWRMHLSVMSIFAPSKTVGFNFSPITQKAVKLGLSIFNTLITVTAWVHICLYIVQNYYDLSFFDVFYTIAVSSTSGLSTQIIPDNTFSRIVIMYVMIVGAIFIPTNLAELLALVRNKSPYDKSYKGSLYRSHVLIVGNLEYNSLRDFLWEFFCEDHGTATMTTQVVLMAPLEPSEDVESLLADPLYISRVKYVKGSPMSFRSLQKAKAREAKACFVLASTFSDKGAEEDDAETVMTALAIKKFHKKANIFAQVVLPGNKIHFQILADHILCIDEFKHGMLAQNCLAPGFSTLMYLLTTSIPNSIKDTFKERSRNSEWIPEYADGAEMEIYAVNLSSLFAGMSFPKAAERIYMSHGALVFAIGFKVANSEPTIVMNPQNYVICGGETAYIITTQSAVADTIASEGVSLNDVSDAYNPISLLSQMPDDRGMSTSPMDASSPKQPEELRDESPRETPPRLSTSAKSAKNDLISFGSKVRAAPNVEQDAPSAESVLNNSVSRDKLKESIQAPKEAPTWTLPKDVENHVLVCCLGDSFPRNLAFFVAPFRHKDLRPIVILCKEEPACEQWAKLSAFTQVYYVIGSPMSRKDLKLASVSKASTAVIMANPLQQNRADRAADANALLSVLNIQAMTSDVEDRNIFTMVEFIHPENAKFIGNGEKYYSDGVHGHDLMPCFVAGHVFFNGMFSSLLCQTYYNPHLLHVLKHFIFNGTHYPSSQQAASSGRVFSSIFRSDSHPAWFDFLTQQLASPSAELKIEPDSCDRQQNHGNLFQIQVPEKYAGVSYGVLLKDLLRDHHALAIALYRRTVERRSLLKYVVVNPKSALRLRDDDFVFIFAEKVPVWASNGL